MSLDERLRSPEGPGAPVDLDRALDGVLARAGRMRRRRNLASVAAGVALAAVGTLGTIAVLSGQDRDPVVVGIPAGELPRVLPTQVPDGMVLVTADIPAIGVSFETWAGSDDPWREPALYELTYSEPHRPLGAPWRGFGVEVLPGSPFDPETVLRDHPGTEVVNLGGEEAVVAVEGAPEQPEVRVLVLVGPDLAVRVRAVGLDRSEALAVAASIGRVDQTTWESALAGADVAPPFGFIGDPTEIAAGDGWSVVAGPHRRPSEPARLCVQADHQAADRDAGVLGTAWCDDILGDRTDGPSPEVLHARVGADVLVWGLVPGEAALVRLVYDETTIELEPDRSAGGLLLRRWPVPGRADTVLLVAGSLDVERGPSEIRAFDADGEILASIVNLTDREIPPG